MSMLGVGTTPTNIIDIKAPNTFIWGLQDNSAADSGRVQDSNDTMHKNRTSQKRKIQLSWIGPSREETSTILQAFNPEYVFVRYPDSMSGVEEIREFYVGDRSSPVKIWTINNKRYESVSFNLIER